MRTMFTKFLAFSSVALLMLASCKKDENRAIATSGTGGNLTASSTTPALSKTNLTATAITFNLTSANFGFQAATTNTLQIDVASDNFAKPKETVLGAGVKTQSFTNLDFNNLLLALNMPTGQSSQVQARIKYQLSSTTAPVYSNVVNLTVTPFAISSSVYVPGAYEGWKPSVADSLVSATSNGIYTGIINFTGSDLNFKIVTSRSDSWNGTNYGVGSSPGTVSGSSSAGNLTAPADGGLLLTLDLNQNTLSFTPQWSIIGDATAGGWGTDTNMFFDKTNNLWYITTKLVSNGTNGLKFRFKNDWTVNLGGSNGTLTQGGANINIPATAVGGDTYKITLDPVANTYTLVKQ